MYYLFVFKGFFNAQNRAYASTNGGRELITQKEIQDAVFLIIENLEECTDDTLERLSFNIWAKMLDRGYEGVDYD